MQASDHEAFVEALRARVLDGPGDTPASLRRAIAERSAGGWPVDAPFDDVARQIGEAAFRVTDAQVAALVGHVGEPPAFEAIIAAAVGAGFHRWRRGMAVLQDAIHAPR